MIRWWASRTKILTLALLALASGSLGATTYRASNSIGQDLGPWHEEAYYLVIEEGTRALYHDQSLLFVEEIQQRPRQSVVIRRDGNGSLRTTVVGLNGPVQVSDGPSQIVYQYDDDGRLEAVATLVDGQVARLEAFSYQNGGDGALSAVASLASHEELRTYARYGRERIFSYSIDGEGESFTTWERGEIVQGWQQHQMVTTTRLAIEDDGTYTITTKDRTDFYDATGRLARRDDGGVVTEYRYNGEGGLSQSVAVGLDGIETTTYYEKEMAVKQEERRDGQLLKSIRYGADGGRVETLYVKGQPYSDVTYAPDSVRVLSIVYHSR